MSKFRYSEEMVSFLRANYGKFKMKELTIKFNKEFGLDKSARQLNRVLVVNKIKKQKPKQKYSQEMLDFIKEHIEDGTTNKGTAELFNEKFDADISAHSIAYIKRENGYTNKVRKAFNALLTYPQEEFALKNYKGITSIELTNMINEKFGTSITPKQIQEWKATNKLHNGVKTRFGDEGVESPNTRPLGHERKTHRGYTMIKFGPRDYRFKHRLIWEEAYGEIPEGYVISFIDNNPENSNIDNLIMVKKEEQLYATTRIGKVDDAEVNHAVYGLAKLMAATNDKVKNK